MAARKNYFDSAGESVIRVWKESQSGPEEKELHRLFSNGLINEADSANIIRLKYPIFSTFSARVFNACITSLIILCMDGCNESLT